MARIHFDFNLQFWIGLVIFLTTAISNGTIHLTNAIPDAWIPYAVAWANILAIVGTGYLVTALGLHNADPQVRRGLVASQPNTVVVTTDGDTANLANKIAELKEAKNVISTAEVAAATPSAKVVAADPSAK